MKIPPQKPGFPPSSIADEWNAKWYQQLGWSWINPLLSLGFKRPLQLEDIGFLGPVDAAEKAATALDKKLHQYAPPSPAVPKPMVMLKAVASCELGLFLTSGFLKLLGDLLGFVGPLALSGITSYVSIVEDNTEAAALGAPLTPIPMFGELNSGWFWVVAVTVAGFIQNAALQKHHELVMRAGARLKSAISLLVYRKALTVEQKTFKETGTGRITNLQNNDANALNLCCWFVHYLWAAPLQLAISIWLLYRQLGASAFVAVAIFVVLIPIQSKLAQATALYGREASVASDSRLKLLNEALGGIRIVKLFAYEESFWTRISEYREKELRAKRKAAFVGAFNSLVLNAGPMLVSLLSFLTYAYTNPNKLLTPQEAFSSIALFGILRLPLMVFPMLVSNAANGAVAAGRLLPFLFAPDAEDYRRIVASSSSSSSPASSSPSPPIMPELKSNSTEAMPTPPESAVWLNDATLSWTAPASVSSSASASDGLASPGPAAKEAVAKTNAFQLRNLNLSFPVGSLTQVVGAAGSGKSSLIAAVVGEIPYLLSGSVSLLAAVNGSGAFNGGSAAAAASVPPTPTSKIAEWSATSASASASAPAPRVGSKLAPPRIAVCSQQAWLCNGTLVENVCFGLPFDLQRYLNCIAACALGPDISSWPSGHQTELGEKGVTCSGGQKARVQLARCLYAATFGRTRKTAGPSTALSLSSIPPVDIPTKPAELEKHVNAVAAATGTSSHDQLCSIVLLDDILSAVDAHTGSWLFKHAICNELLGGRVPTGKNLPASTGDDDQTLPPPLTVIMTTHQLQFVGASDAIVVMEHGRVSQWGTYRQLLAQGDSAAQQHRKRSSSSSTTSKNASGSGGDNNLFAAMIAERGRTAAALATAASSSALAAPPAEAAAAVGHSEGEKEDKEEEEEGEAEDTGSGVGEIALAVPAEDEGDSSKGEGSTSNNGSATWSDVSLSSARDSVKDAPDAAVSKKEAATATEAAAPAKKAAPIAPASALMSAEERLTGAVSLGLFWKYLRGFGGLLFLLTAVCLVLSNIALVGTDLWLSAWSQQAAFYVNGVYTGPSQPGVGTGDHPIGYWLLWYGIITLVSILLAFGFSMAFAAGAILSARSLHAGMLKTVLRAPILFFDSTPLGRITNRFQGDVSAVDMQLPAALSSFLNSLLRILCTLIVQAIVLPWTLLAMAPLVVFYALTQLYYRSTSRELKRLDAISKSPVLAHLSETLSGLSVLKAFRVSQAFASVTAERIDANNNCYLKYSLVNRWLGIRLDFIGVILVSITAIVAVATAGKVDSGLIGLAISYALSITGSLNWLVRQMTESESYGASIERLQSYSAPQLQVEKPPVIEDARPRPTWPEHGQISFRNLTVRYREGLPPVLKNVSIDIAAGSKVGICGRTGSGKSSATLALFRMLEPLQGQEAKDALALCGITDAPDNSNIPPITIDGVDICKIGLDDLRSRISIIPQDPVLFAASLRYNLDPTGRMKDLPNADELLWQAVCSVQLGSFIKRSWAAQKAAKSKAEREKKKKEKTKPATASSAKAAGVVAVTVEREPTQEEEEAELMKRPDVDALSFEIEDGGQNLSVGQRQLLQVARSLLRGSRVLVLDEASASISGQDDAILQETLKGLKGITIIAIAHRLATIISYDRVLLLDHGNVLEYDEPTKLLADPSSSFAKLVAEASGNTGSDEAH